MTQTRSPFSLGIVAALILLPLATKAGTLATLSFDAPASYESARALQLMAADGLGEAGLTAVTPDTMSRPLSIEQALDAARAAGAGRHFHLTAAPLREGAMLSLEEVSLSTGSTLYRQGAVLLDETDAQRTLGRLAVAVTQRKAFDETQRIATVTAAEAQPHEKLPGEFLFGGSVSTLLTRGDGETIEAFGSVLTFAYEMAHAAVGIEAGFFTHDDNFAVETTVYGEYYFFDTDWSPYVGGGLGYGYMNFAGVGEGRGMHAVAGVGVEGFRLHAARLKIGADVMLPFYELEGDGGWLSDDEGSGDSTWVAAPRLHFAVLF